MIIHGQRDAPAEQQLSRLRIPTTAATPGTSVVAIKTRQPHLILTFDDGPEPGGTDAVLRALERSQASATFFVLLCRALRHLSLLQELIEAGHEIGFHGVEHLRLTGLSDARLVSDLRGGRQKLEDLVGRRVIWFRPPFGAQSSRTWRAILSAQLFPVFFGPMCRDWLDLPAEEHLHEVRTRGRAGEILLMHDGYAGNGHEPSHDRGDLTTKVLEIAGARCLVGRSLGESLSEPDSELICQPRLDGSTTAPSSGRV